jgi:DNA-binding NarL/FixJ family response regulator
MWTMADSPLTAVVCEGKPDLLSVFVQLTTEAGFEVVGAVDKAIDAIEMAKMLSPALMVVDQDLPYLSGLEALPQLRQVAPGVEVLLVTGDETLHDEAMRAGAFGIVYKTKLHELSGALRRVKEFIETADERDPAERRTGKDRRQRQDWNKVTSERRSGRDRRQPDPDPDADSTDR